MYSRDELCRRSLKCYFAIHYLINTKTTFSGTHKQFATRVHTLIFINWPVLNRKTMCIICVMYCLFIVREKQRILAYWGRVTHISSSKLNQGRLIYGLLLTAPLGTRFSVPETKYMYNSTRKYICKFRLQNGDRLSWPQTINGRAHYNIAVLTHLPLMPHIHVNELGQLWFR